ncbi:MAG: alpha/beta fold hydrolase [Caulobacterales bacterium]
MSEEIDKKAAEWLNRTMGVRRRVSPRIAEAFRDADDIVVDTPVGRVQAWRLGEGPAVMLVHGWEDDHALWGPLIGAFQQMGRAVIALDLPGHGVTESEDSTQEGGMLAVQAVAKELGPIDAIVGHSFGCAVTGMALANGLDAERAVFIAAPINSRVEPKGRTDEERAVFERAMQMYEERFGRKLGGRFDFVSVAPTMTAKALFVHSVDDDQCPVGPVQDVVELWPGAEILLADGLGHRLIAQDADVLTQIVEFVEGFPPR